jgi:GPH family glycoside/pentoside/hexuronide:cation symporter
MCTAQISKIVCYDPAHPYLVLIPTMLLSAGMLMFFTLGSSMVGDVCDQDELHTGSRREGTYYSVFWWFIKMGTAFASFVTGALLLYTSFDEKQNVQVESLLSHLAAVGKATETWEGEDLATPVQQAAIEGEVRKLVTKSEETFGYFDRKNTGTDHTKTLIARMEDINNRVSQLAADTALLGNREKLKAELKQLSESASTLKTQDPETLFRLRYVEIGLPLLLSIASAYFAWRYPLTEERCYEIKLELERRHAAETSTA